MHPLLRCGLLLALLVRPALAQVRRPSTFEVMGGFSSASLTLGNESTGALVGMSFGVALDVRMSDRLSLRPEFHVVEKGGEDRFGASAAAIDVRAADVPLLAVYRFGRATATVRPTVALGPSVSVLLSCSAEVNASGTIFAGDCSQEMKSLDVDAVVGAGLDIRNGGFSWSVLARYQQGLTDISNTPGVVKTRTIQLLVALRP